MYYKHRTKLGMAGRRLLFAVLISVTVELSLQHGFEIDPEQDPQDTLRRSDFIRDKEHLKEHLTDIDFDVDNASPGQLDFHFFKSHDFNNDNKLDGLELLHAINHAVEGQLEATIKPGQDRGVLKNRIKNHLIGIVDKILEDDDADRDGYINYAEFAHTRRASEMLHQIETSKK